MKHRIAHLLLVLATVSPALATPPAPVLTDDLVAFSGKVHARVGFTRAELVAQLGPASEEFSDRVWAYWDFRAVHLPASEKGDALIVLFANDRVSLLRFTTRTAVEAALVRLRASPPPAVLARK